MKEKKDKTIWAYIKEHKKQVILLGVIILIVGPLSAYGLSEISLLPVTGGNDWAGFWGGYFGAVIGGICTFWGVFLSIQFEREKGREDDKKQVLPFITVNVMRKRRNVSIKQILIEAGKLSQNECNNMQDKNEDEEYYEEYILNKAFFVIDENRFYVYTDLSEEAWKKVHRDGLSYRDGLIKEYILSVPITLENVGNGPAINMKIGLKSEDHEYDSIGPIHLTKGQTFYIHIFSDKVVNDEYVLGLRYQNIFGDNYMQEFPITVSERKVIIHYTNVQEERWLEFSQTEKNE